MSQSWRGTGAFSCAAGNEEMILAGNNRGELFLFDLEAKEEAREWRWGTSKESLLSLSLMQKNLLSCTQTQAHLWRIEDK